MNCRKGFLYFLLIVGFAADFGDSGDDSAGTVTVKTAGWMTSGDTRNGIAHYDNFFQIEF